MWPSAIRSCACAAGLAAGLASPAVLFAAEQPVPRVAAATLTGQGNSLGVSDANVFPIFLIVGADTAYGNAGAATIFTSSNVGFKKVKTLREADQPNAEFGKSVSMALSGKIALVGAPNYGNTAGQSDGPGSAFLYAYKAKTWQKVTALLGTNALGSAHQGEAVFISPDGSTAFVGGPADDNGKGAVWVYDLRKGTPVQQGKLTPNDGAGGNGSRFGVSISSSRDGKRVVIGGVSDGGNGAVWIFERNKKKWSQSGSKITAPVSEGSSSAGVGSAVAMTWDGNIFAASAPNENGGKGAVYVYERTGGGTWSMAQKLTDNYPNPGYGALGTALAIQPYNGGTIVASEPYADTSDGYLGRVLSFEKRSFDPAYSPLGVLSGNPCSELGRSLALPSRGEETFLLAGSPKTVKDTTETGGTCLYARDDTGAAIPWVLQGSPIIAK